MAHVASWKKDVVSEIVADITSYPVTAVVSMEGIAAPQLQSMRAGLRGHAKVRMAKNKLLKIALAEAAEKVPGLEQLEDAIDGQCAIVATDLNPFKLFNKLKATQTPAAAKAGQLAPEDIVVPEGPTPFGPGPIIGELQKLGLPAQIMAGKIVIKKNTTVVKKGEPISADLAAMLPKLEILPMVVGMDARAVFGDGIVYSREVLDVPDGYYQSMLATAAYNALALAVDIVYPAKETMVPLVTKAYRSAYALSLEAAIPTSETIGALFAKADSQMLALASASGYTSDAIAGKLAAAPVASTSAAESAPAEKVEEPEEEEVSEEDAAAGLSALFG